MAVSFGSRPSPLPSSLVAALHQSRSWGFLGEGPVETHVSHAQGFADAAEWADSQPGLPGNLSDPPLGEEPPWLDLGSGGGIPGLVLAHRWPGRSGILLDSSERRTRFLSEVVESQGWGSRIRVITDRAEVAGRSIDLRGSCSLVVARSFGSPPVTAECAAPFLSQGGVLVVSEPPADLDGDSSERRWPLEGLAMVGLESVGTWRDVFGYQVLRQHRECPDRFPRRVGVPAKKPIYRISGTSIT